MFVFHHQMGKIFSSQSSGVCRCRYGCKQWFTIAGYGYLRTGPQNSAGPLGATQKFSHCKRGRLFAIHTLMILNCQTSCQAVYVG